jgi:hypothetical protein
MAINWSNIEGYREEMTPEEKLALLEANEDYGIIDPDMKKSKAQFDKVSSELAAAKKQLKEKMTEDERKEAERAAADQELRDELESLRREKTLNQYKNALLSQGYDDKRATEFAQSMVEGNTNKMFEIMKAVQGDTEKRLRSEILKDTPTPPAGGEEHKEEDVGIRLAKSIGANAAAANKTANDIISKYL